MVRLVLVVVIVVVQGGRQSSPGARAAAGEKGAGGCGGGRCWYCCLEGWASAQSGLGWVWVWVWMGRLVGRSSGIDAGGVTGAWGFVLPPRGSGRASFTPVEES